MREHDHIDWSGIDPNRLRAEQRARAERLFMAGRLAYDLHNAIEVHEEYRDALRGYTGAYSQVTNMAPDDAEQMIKRCYRVLWKETPRETFNALEPAHYQFRTPERSDALHEVDAQMMCKTEAREFRHREVLAAPGAIETPATIAFDAHDSDTSSAPSDALYRALLSEQQSKLAAESPLVSVAIEKICHLHKMDAQQTYHAFFDATERLVEGATDTAVIADAKNNAAWRSWLNEQRDLIHQIHTRSQRLQSREHDASMTM